MAAMTTTARQAGFPTVAERQSALLGRHDRWVARTLDQLLDWAAAEWPERPFVIGECNSFSYREMASWSRRLAAGLQRAGIRPGEHVAVLMANCPEFIALRFALSRIGAVAVPVNMLNRQRELEYVLRQSDSVMLVTMSAFRDLDYQMMLDGLAPGWEGRGGGSLLPRLRKVLVLPGKVAARPAATPFASLDDGTNYQRPSLSRPQELADIIYTSGTTGEPKGVLLTHDMLLRTAFTSALGRAFEDGRRILFSLPMYHVFGYVEGLLAAPWVGGSVVPMARFDAAAMLDRAEATRATDLLAVPTMTLALVDAQRERARDLTSVRAILSSGARAPARVWDEIAGVLGILETTTGYGMTEVTASSTVTRPDDPPARLRTTNGRLRDAGPAGDPALGGRLVMYRVVDPATGAEVAPGQVGELRAHGPGVTTGYYNKPEETAAAFDEQGCLRTGDLGSIDAGGYLVLAGRLKESYRCGGEQVMPTEVEDLLTRHPDVVQAHVVPRPDERMGEIGVGFVVLREGASVGTDELIEMVAGEVARFKVPRHLFVVPASEIPTTASGRARKFLLAAKVEQLLRS